MKKNHFSLLGFQNPPSIFWQLVLLSHLLLSSRRWTKTSYWHNPLVTKAVGTTNPDPRWQHHNEIVWFIFWMTSSLSNFTTTLDEFDDRWWRQRRPCLCHHLEDESNDLSSGQLLLSLMDCIGKVLSSNVDGEERKWFSQS